VFSITLAIFVLELIGGIAANSLALLADAGHVFTDVVGVGLALLAIWIAARPANDERTYGYYRAEILGAVLNAVLLLVVAAYILFEAWQRLSAPPEIETGLMLLIGVVGGAANLTSMLLLRDAQAASLNMRGAYLEVLGDLIGSLAVVVAAIVIAATGFVAADAIASVAIGVLIVPRTWRLLRDAIDVLLEATPKGIRLSELRAHLMRAENVLDIHDLHVWTITSGMKVASAHVVIADDANPASVLD